MQPAGTCHTDVSLTGVRDQTNFLSDVRPSCLSFPFTPLASRFISHKGFSKILMFKMKLRLELVPAQRCALAVAPFFGVFAQKSGRASLAAGGWISSAAQSA